MKAIIISLLSLFFAMPVYTQNYTTKIAEYMDITLIDSIVNTLYEKEVDTIFVYQTTVDNSSIDLPCSTTDTFMSMSYIIWEKQHSTFVIPVSECAIYKEWVIDSSLISNFEYLDSVWVRKSEEPQYLLDNLRTPFLSQIVYLYAQNKFYVMELGSNSEYLLNTNLEKYRQDFVILINEVIQITKQDFIINRLYDRYSEYEK